MDEGVTQYTPPAGDLLVLMEGASESAFIIIIILIMLTYIIIHPFCALFNIFSLYSLSFHYISMHSRTSVCRGKKSDHF